MTPANVLTILRVLLVPVFVTLILYGEMVWALAVFVLAGVTDLLDGLIARRFNQRSELGTFLDPLADKLLLVSSFVLLSLKSLDLSARIPLWLTITVISRDVLLVVGALLVNLSMGKHVFPPTIYGKWTTTFQLATVFLVLVCDAVGFSTLWLQPLFFMTLAITIFSGLHYLSRGMRLIDFNSSRPSD